MARPVDPVEKSRVRWLCRRGMKELDVLLEGFLSTDYDRLDAAEHAALLELLALQDPDLYALIAGRIDAQSERQAGLVARIRDQRKPKGHSLA